MNETQIVVAVIGAITSIIVAFIGRKKEMKSEAAATTQFTTTASSPYRAQGPRLVFVSTLAAGIALTALIVVIFWGPGARGVQAPSINVEGGVIEGGKTQTGTVSADASANGSEWKLAEGRSLALFRKTIRFSGKLKKPHVVVALAYFHAASGHDTNIGVNAENVSDQGFDLVIRTGVGSIIYGAAANWVAYGE